MDTNSKNNIRGTISPTAERWIRGAAILAMVIVALASAILSFDGLQRLALESQIPANLAFLFPIAIDVTILMGSLAVLLYELFNLKAFFGWFTVLFGTALSVTGNIISVSDAGIVAQVLHGIIPILLCISLESLLRILRFNIRRTVESGETLPDENYNPGEANFMDETLPEKVVSESFWEDKAEPELLVQSEVGAEEPKGITRDDSTVSPAVTVPVEITAEQNTSLPLINGSEVYKINPMESDFNEEKVEKKTVTPAAPKKEKAAVSAKPSTAKKSRKLIPPLEIEERDSLRKMFESFPTDHPNFKKLGEVFRVKSEIPLSDIRYILGYPEGKRVDSLVKNARDFASES